MSAPTHHTIRRAFTLVEMIVVIAIIVLLMTITITVGSGVLSKSESEQTENILNVLDMAISEWQNQADRQVGWGIDDAPFAGDRYTVQAGDDPQQQLVDALNELRRVDAVGELIARINGKFFTVDESSSPDQITRLVDAFDNPIYMVHPGMIASDYSRLFGHGTIVPAWVTVDADGTVYVNDDLVTSGDYGLTNAESHEQIYGRCNSRRVLFVSAGPDGRFGDRSAAADTEEYRQTLDNLYSYPPEKS